MHNPSWVKREFLKKWMTSLKIYTTSNKNMTVSDRKNAIKSSADIAMASSRNRATRWSRALIVGRVNHTSPRTTQRSTSGKILKRRRRVRPIAAARNKCGRTAAEWIARKLVEKRTKVLRGLVPGGEFMDETSLIEETLDYISALQAQVHVMRCLATAYSSS